MLLFHYRKLPFDVETVRVCVLNGQLNEAAKLVFFKKNAIEMAVAESKSDYFVIAHRESAGSNTEEFIDSEVSNYEDLKKWIAKRASDRLSIVIDQDLMNAFILGPDIWAVDQA